MLSSILFILIASSAPSVWANSNLETHVDSLDLEASFTPVVASEFMGNPHHHRTPFAVSPDGNNGYVAYLQGSGNVHVQKVTLDTFKKDGKAITVSGAMEASGLVAHNDGFALLTHLNMTQDGPEEYWIPTVLRYKNGKQAWSTPVGGKTVTFNMFPDTKFRANKGSLDGDLKFGENGTYAAFFRAEYYGGSVAGHGGDSIVYLDDKGLRINGKYSQTQHCGHNFGIALSTSKNIPFAAVCTSDDGNISIASSSKDEMPTIGEQHPEEMFAAEAFGGTRGSYSGMVHMGTGESYLLAWVARPAGGSDHLTRIVRVAQLSAKDTVGRGPKDVTQHQDKVDCINAHIATIDDTHALVSWEENDVSDCDGNDFNGYGCGKSRYTGTKFQIVDASGSNQGSSFSSSDVFVSGDIAKVGSKLCWPYVNMKWSSSSDDTIKGTGNTVKKLSFACYASSGSSKSSPIIIESAETSSAILLQPSQTNMEVESTAVTTPSVSEPADQTCTLTGLATTPLRDWLLAPQPTVGAVPTSFVTKVKTWSEAHHYHHHRLDTGGVDE
ncbi:hypothetical protein N0V90_009885 [Kalmusia sp. IMI 367209]|nr:hypothetical protein N0V90_009885 [Kalmusia sp. IMI 367209]